MNHRALRTIVSALLSLNLFPSWSDPRARLSANEFNARERGGGTLAGDRPDLEYRLTSSIVDPDAARRKALVDIPFAYD